METILQNLTKEDLIKVIGNIADVFQTESEWVGYGFSIDDAKSIEIIGDACKQHCSAHGWLMPLVNPVDSPNVAAFSGDEGIKSLLSEQMDKTISEAKGEIEAFIEHKIRNAGLEAIGASKDFPTIGELTETISNKQLNK